MSRLLRNVALALGVVASPAAAQTTINFNELPGGTFVAGQYPGVTFSPEPGHLLLVYDLSFRGGSSTLNALCSFAQGRCLGGHTIEFASAVNDVSIRAIDITGVGVSSTVSVYGANGLLGTLNLTGQVNAFTQNTLDFDFAQFANIRKLEFSGNTTGMAWDDLTYTTAVAVPEPASALLLLSGVGGLIAVVRRRKTVIEG